MVGDCERLWCWFMRAGFVVLKGVRMSSIGDVKVAEKRVKEIMEKLREASPKDDISILHDQLKKATDEYSKAVLKLKLS